MTFVYLMGIVAADLQYANTYGYSVALVSMTIAALLCIQVALGIINVVKLLPLAIAVAHNGVAVLLLIAVVALLQRFHKNAVSTPVA